MKRQLVELEREIGLTTPLIAELDNHVTGHAGAVEQMQTATSPLTEPTSSVEPVVKTTEVDVSSYPATDKLVTGVDSGLQMESPVSSSRSFQVCDTNGSWPAALLLLEF